MAGRRFAIAAAMLAVVVSAGTSPAATTPVCVPGGPWARVGGQTLDHLQSVSGWSNQTLRFEATTASGGSQLRIHLSNEWSSNAVTFAHVSVAQQQNQAQSAGSPTAVTFNGATSVTVAGGAETASDAIAFPTTPGEKLLVSIYLPSGQSVTSAPVHTYAGETEYNIVGQDGTMQQNPGVSNTFGFTAFLDGIDVDASSAQTVVAVGDSITDLAAIPNDSDTRWTDYLGRRTSLAVVNAGIAGNRVTADEGSAGGPSLQTRWQHDALGVPGIRSIIDEDGINDLRNGVSASTLESAQASLVSSAHAAGLRILLSTLTPCAGDSQCTSAFETQRQAYNAWVRSGASGADGVADFDLALANGTSLAGMYSTNSLLHPNEAGMEAMANIVDVSKL